MSDCLSEAAEREAKCLLSQGIRRVLGKLKNFRDWHSDVHPVEKGDGVQEEVNIQGNKSIECFKNVKMKQVVF